MCCVTFPIEMWSHMYSPRQGTDNRLKKGFYPSRALWTNGFTGIPSGGLVSLRQLHLWKFSRISKDHYTWAASLGPVHLLEAVQPRLAHPNQLLPAQKNPREQPREHFIILSFSTFLGVVSRPPPSRERSLPFSWLLLGDTQPQCHCCFIQLMPPLGFNTSKA